MSLSSCAKLLCIACNLPAPRVVQKIINRQRQRLDSLIEETSKAPRRLQSKVGKQGAFHNLAFPCVWRSCISTTMLLCVIVQRSDGNMLSQNFAVNAAKSGRRRVFL